MAYVLFMVLTKKLFNNSLESILLYIAKDSKNQAKKFKDELKAKINNLNNNPYKFRKSLYYDDENVRDMVFKGYTIPYLVDDEYIVVIDIFKWVNK